MKINAVSLMLVDNNSMTLFIHRNDGQTNGYENDVARKIYRQRAARFIAIMLAYARRLDEASK